MDSSTLATHSSQHHSYASTNITTTNKISNLVVDRTSYLPQVVSVPSSPSSFIESTITNSNNNNNIIHSLSPNDNVCELNDVFI